MGVQMSDFSDVEIIPVLPASFGPERGKPLPAGIVGAKIVRIGTISNDSRVEGGGLAIDYVPAGDDIAQRVVLGFNELGMWMEWPRR